jgi:hypothetical protein
MSYDLDAMVARFRQEMDDTETPYLWSDEEVIDYLDEAEDEFADLTDAIVGELEMSYSAGQLYLDIPTYVTRIRSVHNAVGRDIRLYNDEEWNTAMIGDDYGFNAPSTTWRTDTGEPKCLITDTVSNKARLYPRPTATGTLVVSVFRRPVRGLAASGTFEVTDRAAQRCILIKAKSLGYNKHDSDVYNPQMSKELYAEFMAEANKFKQRTTRSRRRAQAVVYGGY